MPEERQQKKKKKGVPSSAFSFQVRETSGKRNRRTQRRADDGRSLMFLKFILQLTANCRDEKEKWLNTRLHAASDCTAGRQLSCSASVAAAQYTRSCASTFSPDDVKLMNRHSFHTFFFFFLPSALTRWQSGVIDTSFSSFDFLQRQFNYSISPPKREEKDILSSTKP